MGRENPQVGDNVQLMHMLPHDRKFYCMTLGKKYKVERICDRDSKFGFQSIIVTNDEGRTVGGLSPTRFKWL